MKNPSTTTEMHALLEHQAWVRALAHRLVGDPNLAEDLAQDAYLAALEAPVGSVRSVRAWLATVLRNLVRERARSERNRGWREEITARDEATASTLDLTARVSAHKQVVNTVMELPAHYRDVLLLRYFDGLTPTEIAARLQMPVSSVKTRLQRGLSEMRSELDRESGGDRESWLAALAPIVAMPPGGGVLVDPISAQVVASVCRVVAVCLPLTILSWWGVQAWMDAGDLPQERVEELVMGTALDIAPAAAEAPMPQSRTEGYRSPNETDAEAAERVRRTTPDYPLRGFVRDASGAAAPTVVLGFEPHWNPAGKERVTPVCVSATDGSFEFANAAGAGRVVAIGRGHVTLFAGEVDSDYAEVSPEVIVAPGAALSGEVIDERGAAVIGAMVAVRPPEALSTAAATLEWSSLALAIATTDEIGKFDLGVALDVGEARLVVNAEGYARYDVERPSGAQSELRIVLADAPRTDHDVEGRVVDSQGSPVPHARVALGGSTTLANGAGFFHIAAPDAVGGVGAARTLLAFAPGHGAGRLAVELDGQSGAPLWPEIITLQLGEAPLSITGRVVDERGEPQPHVFVFLDDPTLFLFANELEGKQESRRSARNDLAAYALRYELLEDLAAGERDELAWRRVRTDSDGRFELGGLLERDYELVLFDPGTLRRQVSAALPAGTREAELILHDPERSVRIAGRIVDREGRGVRRVSVQPVCDALRIPYEGELVSTSSQGLRARTTDEQGRFDLGRLDLDSLYLRISGGGGLGGEDVVPLRFARDGAAWRTRSDAELQALEIVVERPCSLRIELRDPSEADEIAVEDEHGVELGLSSLRSRRRLTRQRVPLVRGKTERLRVPETAHVLVLYSHGERVREQELELLPGQSATLRP